MIWLDVALWWLLGSSLALNVWLCLRIAAQEVALGIKLGEDLP